MSEHGDGGARDLIDLQFGALVKPMHEQLDELLEVDRMELCQRLHDAVVLLSVQGIISRAERDQAWNRLSRWIDREIMALEARRSRLVI